MRKLLPKKSKKGITLVESVVAVVLLAMFAIGVLTLLTSGGVKIQEISKDAAAYAEATQKLDLAISAISNGSSDSGYIKKTEASGVTTYSLVVDGDTGLKSVLGLDDVTIIASPEPYPGVSGSVRGWYLELTYNGVTVKGFASNSEGVFDS